MPYAVQVEITKSPKDACNLGRIFHVKNKYSMLRRIQNPNDFYYRRIFQISDADCKSPTTWKTKASAEKVRDALTALMAAPDMYGKTYAFSVVELNATKR